MKKRLLVLVTVGLLALMGLVQATSTMNPRITYTGNGVPDPNVGRVGDLYIDLDTNILYIMGTSSWGVFAVLPTPVNGTNGLNGATWIVGDVEPASEIGSNGDLYFNCATLDIYYKTNGVWTYLVNLQGQTGPQGPQGETGPAGQDGVNGTNGVNGVDGVDGKDGINGTDGRNGSIWYNELIANLTDNLGHDGDYYMFTNGTVYYKMNGNWIYYTSLVGPVGLQGETGETGPQGPAGLGGVNGTNGIDGVNGANGIDGTDGKDGINGKDGTNGLNGQDGVNGINGAVGATGATGLQGAAGADASVPWWLYLVAAICLGAAAYSVYKSRGKSQKDSKKIAHGTPIPITNALTKTNKTR